VIIRWADDSPWGYAWDGRDHKGLASIIRPAIAALKREGLPVWGVFHDRNDTWVPYSEMVRYFNSLHIYVCASDTEGAALPVLEAMACGLPLSPRTSASWPRRWGLGRRSSSYAAQPPRHYRRAPPARQGAGNAARAVRREPGAHQRVGLE
jgi:hypothetical protein